MTKNMTRILKNWLRLIYLTGSLFFIGYCIYKYLHIVFTNI